MRRRTLLAAAVALVACSVGAAACVTVLGLDDFVPDLPDDAGPSVAASTTGTGTTSDGAGGSSCTGTCSEEGCGACPMVSMVKVPTGDGGTFFEIDPYEI